MNKDMHNRFNEYKIIEPILYLLFLLLPASALGQSSMSVDDLLSQLTDPRDSARLQAVIALKDKGIKEERVIKGLTERLKDDKEVDVRSSAAYALGVIGADTEEAVEQLINALRAENEDIRFNAAAAFMELGAREGTANPRLLRAMEPLISTLETDPSVNVRQEAAVAIAEIGAKAKQSGAQAVPHLVRALNFQLSDLKRNYPELKDLNDNDPRLNKLKDDIAQLRQKSVLALGKIGAEVRDTIPSLIGALEDKDDAIVRRFAAEALGKKGLEARVIIPSLVEVVRKDINNPVRISAARSIVALCNAIAGAKDREAVEVLKNARQGLPETPEPPTNETDEAISKAAREIDTTVEYLELLGRPRLLQFVDAHPYLTPAIAAYLALMLAVLMLLRLRPLWILRANEFLSAITELHLPLPKPFDVIKLPLPRILFLGFFHFHPRVLDAWVTKYLDTARKVFAQKPTVFEHEVYINVPVVLERQNIRNLTAKDLQPLFARNISHLLILGDDGAGKTSLACELGKWAMSQDSEKRLCSNHSMLPILLENELSKPNRAVKNPLLHAIQKQLRILIEEEDAAPLDLVRHLLKRRRVLLIVDSLSEMTPASRANFISSISETPVNAIIITSRTSEGLGELQPQIMSPMRVGGDTLSVS